MINRSTYVIILGIALLGIIACGYAFRRVEPFEEKIDPEKLLEKVKLQIITECQVKNLLHYLSDKSP